MRCHFINLDRATERRAAVEASFARAAPSGWELVRFPAIEAAAQATPGNQPAAVKACFASHRALLASADPGESLFVVEDDVVFSRACFAFLDAVLPARAEWDILFTDVAVADRNFMDELVRRRRGFVGRFETFDLAGLPFVAATAYVVRAQARARVDAILAAHKTIDMPYDFALREAAHRGELKAACVFPFLTSVSDHGEASQIQPAGTTTRDLAFTAFRQLMFVERDMAACLRLAEAIERRLPDDARIAAAAFAGLIPPP